MEVSDLAVDNPYQECLLETLVRDDECSKLEYIDLESTTLT
jgi:hypothetical protein